MSDTIRGYRASTTIIDELCTLTPEEFLKLFYGFDCKEKNVIRLGEILCIE